MPEISEEELKVFKEAKEQADALAASKKRLEEENSKYKTRAKTAEEKLSDAEKKKLEAEGDLNQLLEIERKKTEELSNQLLGNTKAVLKEKIRAEVSKFAKDAHDVDMVLKVTEHQGLLKRDEENLSVSGVEDFVGKVRETHSYLFSGKRMPDYNNTKGGNTEDDKGGTGDSDYATDLANAKTSKELEAVRKKHGKSVATFGIG